MLESLEAMTLISLPDFRAHPIAQTNNNNSAYKPVLIFRLFWSNSNFMSNILQSSLFLRCKSKAGENILPCQFWKISKNFLVCHVCRQPSQNIINCDTSISYTGFTESFFRINSDNIMIIGHNNAFNKLQYKSKQKISLKKSCNFAIGNNQPIYFQASINFHFVKLHFS